MNGIRGPRRIFNASAQPLFKWQVSEIVVGISKIPGHKYSKDVVDGAYGSFSLQCSLPSLISTSLADSLSQPSVLESFPTPIFSI